jgi:hypothetical protein
MTLTYYGRLQITAVLMYLILAVGAIRTLIQQDHFYLEASAIAALVAFVMGNVYQVILAWRNGFFQPNWMVWMWALLELGINVVIGLIINADIGKLVVHYIIAWVVAAGFVTFVLQVFVRDVGDRSGELLGG